MSNSLIERYFQSNDPAKVHPGFLAYLANLECVARVAPEVARSIVQELVDRGLLTPQQQLQERGEQPAGEQ